MTLFDEVARRFNITPAPIIPQQHPTSKQLMVLNPEPVKLLVGPLNYPTMYTQRGVPSKKQRRPLQKGEEAWVTLGVDGLVSIMPFALAGTGYELLRDAREGVHYVFI